MVEIPKPSTAVVLFDMFLDEFQEVNLSLSSLGMY